MSDVVETKSKRGRETAGDMVRSLGLVLAAVIVIWYLAQPPASDSQEVRVVDPSGSVSAFAADVPGAAVPGTLPEQWRPTSATLGREPASLRVGYVTPSGRYAEYAATAAPVGDDEAEILGTKVQQLQPVQVAGGTWEQYADEDGSLSLVRSYGSVRVVLGTLRATAPLGELRTLAESLTVP